MEWKCFRRVRKYDCAARAAAVVLLLLLLLLLLLTAQTWRCACVQGTIPTVELTREWVQCYEQFRAGRVLAAWHVYRHILPLIAYSAQGGALDTAIACGKQLMV